MEDEPRDLTQSCFGTGSVVGAVIGTFLTTVLLLIVAALLYKQWRKHKGKHLVLVTDPEIVDDAYAFDNPCFKDVGSSVSRILESSATRTSVDSPPKDTTLWATSWTSLALGSANRNDKRRIHDDSCIGAKTTKISVVSLKSRDFTGLGFNVCGNMREGIFVKDLLHRGPASESGRIHSGDRIASVKINFRNMVYEDALTILSYASPYDVELEVESGISGSKQTTLSKKIIGVGAERICHPIYRSQSIPELSNVRNVAKKLFIVDPNESVGVNCSTLNSTLKSTKSTPTNQTFEKRRVELKNNHHQKFGIKVLPAFDGTVHRIENQNEHNTNLERRHSKKLDAEKLNLSNTSKASPSASDKNEETKIHTEKVQQNKVSVKPETDNIQGSGIGVLDKVNKSKEEPVDIPSEVPTEVHNAAMAARRNRKNGLELQNVQKNVGKESIETDGTRSPQRNKRKAPAPPKSNVCDVELASDVKKDLSLRKDCIIKKVDAIENISDYADSLMDYATKVHEIIDDASPYKNQRTEPLIVNRRNSDSDTDSELKNTLTTIELNPADITIHRTPVPETVSDKDNANDVYRKAASLGDLSRYECKSFMTLERAQSLDMTDTGSKKRKAPLPPEDINESIEDLTKFAEIDSFDRRRLKKSDEWGTLEDVIWQKSDQPEDANALQTEKKSNGTLERSKSAVDIKLKDGMSEFREKLMDGEDTSIELYNLPLSKKLTEEFIHSQRQFDLNEDNSLARIVNNGKVVKTPSFKQIELDFRQTAEPLASESNVNQTNDHKSLPTSPETLQTKNTVLKYETRTSWSPNSLGSLKSHSPQSENWKEYDRIMTNNDEVSYIQKRVNPDESVTRITVDNQGHACAEKCGDCEICKVPLLYERSSTSAYLEIYPLNADPIHTNASGSITIGKENKVAMPSAHKMLLGDKTSKDDSSSSNRLGAMQPIQTTDDKKIEMEEDEDEDEYEFGSSVTVNSKSLSDREHRRNINNISASSGENSEDSGLVGESMDYNPQDFENRAPLSMTPIFQKTTYVTEIKVPSSKENIRELNTKSDEIISMTDNKEKNLTQRGIKLASNGKNIHGKKPPVPPRRSDLTKPTKDGQSGKQVIYVSEYKTVPSKESNDSNESLEIKQAEVGSTKVEQCKLLKDKEHNRWGGGSNQAQTITDIVLPSGGEKIIQQ